MNKITYTDVLQQATPNTTHNLELYRQWIRQEFGGLFKYGGKGEKWSSGIRHLRCYARMTGMTEGEARKQAISDYNRFWATYKAE